MQPDRTSSDCHGSRLPPDVASVTRRDFVWGGTSLVALGLASVGLVASLSCGESSDEVGRAKDLAQRMLEIFADPVAAASIGRVYLSRMPEEPSQAALVDRLTEGWTATQRALPTASLHALLRDQQVADFSSGRTLRVGGWVLGHTELRLAALAALSSV